MVMSYAFRNLFQIDNFNGVISLPVMLSKQERLCYFIERLKNLPGMDSKESAQQQISDTLNEVEDEYSGVPYNPNRWEDGGWKDDGRMYPVQADMERPSNVYHRVTIFRSVAHRTFIDSNGAFRITDLDGLVVIEKGNSSGKCGQWAETSD